MKFITGGRMVAKPFPFSLLKDQEMREKMLSTLSIVQIRTGGRVVEGAHS